MVTGGQLPSLSPQVGLDGGTLGFNGQVGILLWGFRVDDEMAAADMQSRCRTSSCGEFILIPSANCRLKLIWTIRPIYSATSR